MEQNIGQELQALKAEYQVFKETIKKQEALNETFFKDIKKRAAHAVNREIRQRIWLDLITVPIIISICIHIHWPAAFGILVSLWALTDLGSTLWINRKLGMSNLLNDNAQAVSQKIARYRKFYRRSLLVSLMPLPVMLVYIFLRLHAQAGSPEASLYIILSGIVFTTLAIAITIRNYKKHVEACNSLLEQFKE